MKLCRRPDSLPASKRSGRGSLEGCEKEGPIRDTRKPHDQQDPTLAELPKPEGEGQPESGQEPRLIKVEVEGGDSNFEFGSTFEIGRDAACEVVVDAVGVSRRHTEVFWEDDSWHVRDLKSTNGTYLGGLRVESAQLTGRNSLTLGSKGPALWLSVEGEDEEFGHSVTHYMKHYVDAHSSEPGARHTRMIRLAVEKASGRQKRRHLGLLAGVCFVFVLALIGVWQFRAAQLHRSQEAANEIFYSMKELELRLARLESREGNSASDSAELREGRSHLRSLSSSYDSFLAEMGLYDETTSEKNRLVLKMARLFGECEATMPEALFAEVNRYIELWKGDTRLERALKRAADTGFATEVAVAFDRYNLPPQYFYLALQESDFRLDVCGPETRYGIAKGPWQFIPSTAIAYGLEVGPLFLQRRPDPLDERHDIVRSSDAAAHYMRDIYLREAQGSGLLSLAIYNYGGSNVRRVIRSLPESPRERNFWRLLLEHRQQFPRETYDYVLRIFSAAVIGEDPQLFGFGFENPLAGVGETSGAGAISS